MRTDARLGAFPTRLTKKRPPHPALHADLSRDGRGRGGSA